MASSHSQHGQEDTSRDSRSPRCIIHPEFQMEDIDPRQWARLFDVLARPNLGRNDLCILHAAGEVLSVTPPYARRFLDLPPRIPDPQSLAAELHRKWKNGSVAVIERGCMQDALHHLQADHVNGDDFFTFMLRVKDHLLRAGSDGIVIRPKPWTDWHSTTPETLLHIVRTIAPDGMRATAFIAAYEEDSLHASALVGFEGERIRLVTTLPPADASKDDLDFDTETTRLIAYAEQRFAPVRAGVLCMREQLVHLGIGPHSWVDWLAAARSGEIRCLPNPEVIARCLAG